MTRLIPFAAVLFVIVVAMAIADVSAAAEKFGGAKSDLNALEKGLSEGEGLKEIREAADRERQTREDEARARLARQLDDIEYCRRYYSVSDDDLCGIKPKVDVIRQEIEVISRQLPIAGDAETKRYLSQRITDLAGSLPKLSAACHDRFGFRGAAPVERCMHADFTTRKYGEADFALLDKERGAALSGAPFMESRSGADMKDSAPRSQSEPTRNGSSGGEPVGTADDGRPSLGEHITVEQGDGRTAGLSAHGGLAASANYTKFCAECHGTSRDAAKLGVPSFASPEWIWGASQDDVARTIRNGVRSDYDESRTSEMPPFGEFLDAAQIAAVADHVVRLARGEPSSGQGKDIYIEQCAVCHSSDGGGNTSFGAPPLNNRIFLRGGDKDAIVKQVSVPEHGSCPGWGGTLSASEIEDLATFVRKMASVDSAGSAR